MARHRDEAGPASPAGVFPPPTTPREAQGREPVTARTLHRKGESHHLPAHQPPQGRADRPGSHANIGPGAKQAFIAASSSTLRKRAAQSLRKTEGNRSPLSGSPERRTPQRTTFPRSTTGARDGVQAAHRPRARPVLPPSHLASDPVWNLL